MNMPGISLTLLNLTNVSEECSIPVPKLLEMLDAPHNSPAWPSTQNMYPVPESLGSRKRQDAWVDVKKEEKPPRKESKQILGTSPVARQMILLRWSNGPMVQCSREGEADVM